MTTGTPPPHPVARLLSVRLITDDVARLVGFYEQVTGTAAVWSTPDFAEVVTGVETLAIGSTRTVALFAAGSARPADNRSAIVEFLVADVDAEHRRLRDLAGDLAEDVVAEPTTMPWGNRSLLLRDPDGNLVNLFTPVTPEAVARFASRG
ncbi:VOC family protein [Kineococcus aurantiacus]|uniref:Putative enzyme related to lactoylglutathione lyase n=1 Tax=Kineococcus aurantiacus TaxID=37633 RepID=A0A7Y9DMP0_9ACTN|nr:VOC family protein [Kineococcus aurantiacus]NYD23427.1 putative enzyme related to lactoylglutathione lyase [Kineococcus aurantiacus]